MSSIKIKKISITDVIADAVVNAANEYLQAGDGVCGIIFNAAGYAQLQTVCNEIGGCKPGDAVITPGFNLSKYIIHAVGPRYIDGKHKEPQLLYSCYRKSLDLARDNGCNSIAFPLISAGIFGYPVDKAFRKALQACEDWFKDNRDYDLEIIFTIPENDKYDIGIKTAKELGIKLLQPFEDDADGYDDTRFVNMGPIDVLKPASKGEEYTLNLALLEKYLIGFKDVLTGNGDPFSLTSANKIYASEELYKHKIAEEAEKLLDRSEWKKEDIGTGKIFSHVKKAMDVSENLIYVTNRLKFYDKCEADLSNAENVLYKLYRGNDDEKAFEAIKEAFGGVYDVIGYLFFIHNSKKYLPISSGNFDKRFAQIGIDYQTSGKCSWENYKGFIHIIRDIRDYMQEYYDIDGVTLLDAHSFVWMFWKIDEYYEESAEEPFFVPVQGSNKSVETTARVGQSQYRKNLLKFWDNKCSVTGCGNADFLIASHIKPWKDSDPDEKGDVYNGLLLTPNLDAAFDQGYITFDDNGLIVISNKLSGDDCKKLGIDKDMKLRKINEKQKTYLDYHRKNVFVSED